MRGGARAHHGNSVPTGPSICEKTWYKCPDRLRPPRLSMNDRARQTIRYLCTRDGVKLAWAEAGAGPLLVKAPNWLTHLTYDLESPVWRHWIQFFSGHTR